MTLLRFPHSRERPRNLWLPSELDEILSPSGSLTAPPFSSLSPVAFQLYDLDRDGKISRNEMLQVRRAQVHQIRRGAGQDDETEGERGGGGGLGLQRIVC